MSFFENSTVEEVIQGHIEKVVNLEDKEAQKLLKNLKSVKQDLSERLFRGRDGTFTEQQLRSTLAQVNAIIEALNQKLKTGMADAVDVLGSKGVEDLVTEVNKFQKVFEGSVQPINLDAATIAQDTNNFLLNQYESSIDAYSEGLRQQITQGLTEAVLAQSNYSQVVYRLGQFFGGEEWKIQRIARTELHNMYNKAKMQGMGDVRDDYLPDLKKTLIHPMDSRTGDDSKYAAKLDLVVNIDEPFVYKYKGQVRRFMTPPDRPNDRSILVPYRKAWDS